ncbi:aspartate--tRNA ligase [endosymbiont 'TC1' of Trimyema compressum]|uniref:aspartate--tRNA ligase n=1 Tax=endosymbiont 'TC1' of Trimyema compressum TaxID=243899 RepID=UPI0007F10146|nr:aspartate--tRNA ligase [endosymbiont 'TC1' of Trimyema compressum]AMP20614.1 aspartate--tRNA ligase [endosymbiont 'TC1' of Trimyema compressum]
MAIEERRACGLVTEKEISETIKVSGWVNRRRDHGGLIFIDLRDRSGLLQIVFDEQFNDFETVEKLRNEYVVEVIGTLRKRSEEAINPKLPTGSIELLGISIKLLNKAKTPVFDVNEETPVDENIRLKYRYLDLRRSEMQKNIILRHHVTMAMRRFLDERGFLEIETPMLAKSTPEGARDYLVPSRVHPGNFFALPQSPQQYKQILMVAGMEKYFQIARCFRDEDLRADRQPEFTQLDMEMSFVDREDIMALVTDMMGYLFKETLNKELPAEFPRITYDKAMNRYGSDRPDLRFDLPLYDIGPIVANTDFKVFKSILDKGGMIKGINGKGCSDALSRRDIDSLTSFVNVYGAKGLAWIAITEDGIKSTIAKFLSEEELAGIVNAMGGEKGDLLMFVADKKEVVHDSLGALRIEIAKRLDLIDENELNFVWVTDFPLLKYDEDEKRYVAIHHMFTHPNPEDMDKLESDPLSVRALAYDLVLNGTELGGGSIRIHEKELQERIFKLIGFSEEEAEEQFGFMLEAFSYGAPSHGGVAFGLDRMIMLMRNRQSIRDVIAFPKTQSAADLMSVAPSSVTEKQLEELSIELNLPEEKEEEE